MDIKDYRLQIDRIDKEIIKLLEERLDVSEGIGEYKKAHGLPVLDAEREKDKLRDVELTASKQKSKYIEGVFTEIMAQSRNYQAAAGPAYGVLGRKLAHSFSPQLHAAFGNDEYEIIEKEPEELEAYMTGGSFKGINVTIPYKRDVIPYCHELSEIARELKSVNTIYIGEHGKLIGDNTDYYGFRYMIKRAGIVIYGKKALVLGSGGVSTTIVKALQDLGAREVIVVSRSGDNNYENISKHKDAEIIVNATPVGMYPNNNACLIDVADFPKLEGVADAIYNPLRTKLVLEAEKAGAKATGGLSMLIAQGAKASELFGGRSISEEEIEQVTRRIAAENGNVVIIGMPGAGKTTIGKLLAEKLGKKFYDLDEYIAEQEKRSVLDIINKDGVESFRMLETAALKELMSQKGCVVALGGGIVERPENYDIIRMNGLVVHIRRNLNELPTDGRPISQKEGVQVLYGRRMPLYEKWCDIEVQNDKLDVAIESLVRRMGL